MLLKIHIAYKQHICGRLKLFLLLFRAWEIKKTFLTFTKIIEMAIRGGEAGWLIKNHMVLVARVDFYATSLDLIVSWWKAMKNNPKRKVVKRNEIFMFNWGVFYRFGTGISLISSLTQRNMLYKVCMRVVSKVLVRGRLRIV